MVLEMPHSRSEMLHYNKKTYRLVETEEALNS